MAFDRKAAKESIQAKSGDDAEFDEAQVGAHDFQLKIAQENNRHAETMGRQDLGFLGRALGGEKTAPTYIAFFVMVAGLAGTFYCWSQAGATGDATGFWSSQAERALAFSASALAYIFGRGNK
ncbi:hypothetical protein ASE04_21190 [Rhizobium sp. Root708]|uniref:hypothetical protein n=1 Tax=Rhizobium sp. Root708 TaxID=1736592 RepID=UPI0006FEA8F8|nr:hypothetical protein [Rhizobium sp. Root708]KRB61384.1 hypothetical protein ASE04_21190 [Rhizobium sp. Root708]